MDLIIYIDYDKFIYFKITSNNPIVIYFYTKSILRVFGYLSVSGCQVTLRDTILTSTDNA
jgi:hypothetical protein